MYQKLERQFTKILAKNNIREDTELNKLIGEEAKTNLGIWYDFKDIYNNHNNNYAIPKVETICLICK